jgi:hypothetical protein
MRRKKRRPAGRSLFADYASSLRGSRRATTASFTSESWSERKARASESSGPLSCRQPATRNEGAGNACELGDDFLAVVVFLGLLLDRDLMGTTIDSLVHGLTLLHRVRPPVGVPAPAGGRHSRAVTLLP